MKPARALIGIGATAPDPGLYRILVESVRDYAIFVLDATGHIVTWNAGAKRIKGYEPSEIIGKHFSTFYSPEEVLAGKPDWELEVAARDGRFEDEGWRVRKDGSTFWANVVITALREDSDSLVGFAKVTRDLTERKAAEERALADARRVAEAEAANRAKGDFLAAMSHELRTPLNAISGYANLLAMGIGGNLSKQQLEYLQRIRASQQHLLAIINDLLNFSRMEAGQVTYELAPVPLDAVIAAMLPIIEPQASEKLLEIRPAAALGHVAWADRVKVEQILLNLLSNAVKFTDPGGQIELWSEAIGENVLLRVRDTGVGIAADQLERIFEPFVQVGRSLSSSHVGTGLGLAISRDLARAMNGGLTVESELGAGATFTLSLPAVPNGSRGADGPQRRGER